MSLCLPGIKRQYNPCTGGATIQPTAPWKVVLLGRDFTPSQDPPGSDDDNGKVGIYIYIYVHVG